jgi:hypothetical protein
MSAGDACLSDRVLLHVGYHKTATTWFQSQLFARADLGFSALSARGLVHRALCIPHALAGDGGEAIRRVVAEANEATARGLQFVISHERLSGYPASGGYDAGLLAERLKRHFPNARVFCLFREQRAMILSAWRQQVVDGGGLSLGHFIDPPEPDIRRMPSFDPAMYRYTRLLERNRALYGAENVLFRPYEEFRARPEAVLAGLAALLRSEPMRAAAPGLASGMTTTNPSLTAPVLHLQRFLNIHFARTQLSPDCLVDLGARPIRAFARAIDRGIGSRLFRTVDARSRKRALARIEDRFGAFFDEDNGRLSALVGARLADFGYRVGAQGRSGA